MSQRHAGIEDVRPLIGPNVENIINEILDFFR